MSTDYGAEDLQCYCASSNDDLLTVFLGHNFKTEYSHCHQGNRRGYLCTQQSRHNIRLCLYDAKKGAVVATASLYSQVSGANMAWLLHSSQNLNNHGALVSILSLKFYKRKDQAHSMHKSTACGGRTTHAGTLLGRALSDCGDYTNATEL